MPRPGSKRPEARGPITLGAVILRNGDDPDARPVAAHGLLALDRGRADRRRRRGARDLAAEPRDGRPRRPLRAPRLHRLARPLPDLGAVAGRRRPARLRVARRGARPGTRRAADRELAARPGLARRRLARRPAHAAGARRGRERPPGDADLQGLPRALAQLGRARARGRRPRGRRWCSRPGRVRRADRRPLRGGGLALQGALRPGAGRGVRRGDARGGQGRGRARRHGAARQGRLARRDRPLATARAAGRPAAPRLAVDTGGAGRRPPRDGPAQRRRLAASAARLPEDVHGRDTRLTDRMDVRRQRCRDHHQRGARGDRA